MRRRLVGTFLIFIGLSIIGSAFYMRYSAAIKQARMTEAFKKSLEELGEVEKETAQPDPSPDSNNAQGTGTGQENNSRPDKKPDSLDIKAMALMVIPKINLQVAVAEGTDNETLKYAVGHFKGTALPGEKGNFAVAGHRSYTYSEYFNRADELEIGDEIIVRTKKGEYTYVVYDKEVVEPDKVSVLDPTSEATVTLVTCTPIRVATHRLIVKGRLK